MRCASSSSRTVVDRGATVDDDLLPDDDAEWHLQEVAHLYHNQVAGPDEHLPEEDQDDDPYAYETFNRRRLNAPRRKFDHRNPSLLDKLALSMPVKRQKQRAWCDFDPSKPVRIRVLDVDCLSLEDVHRHFMHTLVRRLPAEFCLKVASRVGQFRDKPSHQSYENLLRDCGKLFSGTHGPELIALFSRCYATISVPYMVDYTRRFGQFSKQYMAKLIEKTEQPRFFDFMRYEHCGGVRPLPGIIKEPYALASYTRLLSKCSAKRYMFEELQKHGHLPPSANMAELDFDELPLDTRIQERVGGSEPLRPQIMDKIIAREHAKAAGLSVEIESDDEEPMPFASQFQRVAQDPAEEATNTPEAADAIEIADPGERWWAQRREHFKYRGKQYAMVEGVWSRVGEVRRRRHPYRSHRKVREARTANAVKRAHAMEML